MGQYAPSSDIVRIIVLFIFALVFFCFGSDAGLACTIAPSGLAIVAAEIYTRYLLFA